MLTRQTFLHVQENITPSGAQGLSITALNQEEEMANNSRLKWVLVKLTLLLILLSALVVIEPRTQAATCQEQCQQQYQDCLYYLGYSYQTMCQQRRDYCLMYC